MKSKPFEKTLKLLAARIEEAWLHGDKEEWMMLDNLAREMEELQTSHLSRRGQSPHLHRDQRWEFGEQN